MITCKIAFMDATERNSAPESKQHNVKQTLRAGESTCATQRLWRSLEVTYECYSKVQTSLVEAEKEEEDSVKQLNQLRRSILKRNEERNRYLFELGKLCVKLRNLYSERVKSGDRSDKSSGHGTYIRELEERGYDRRRAAEWVHDYEAAENGTLNTAAKRKASRKLSKATKAILIHTTPALTKQTFEVSVTRTVTEFPLHEIRRAVTVYSVPKAGVYAPVTIREEEEPQPLSSTLGVVMDALDRLEIAAEKLSSLTPEELVIEALAANLLSSIITDMEDAHYRIGKLLKTLKDAEQMNAQRKKDVQSQAPETALAVAN